MATTVQPKPLDGIGDTEPPPAPVDLAVWRVPPGLVSRLWLGCVCLFLGGSGAAMVLAPELQLHALNVEPETVEIASFWTNFGRAEPPRDTVWTTVALHLCRTIGVAYLTFAAVLLFAATRAPRRLRAVACLVAVGWSLANLALPEPPISEALQTKRRSLHMGLVTFGCLAAASDLALERK